jgi:hypothetical protein
VRESISMRASDLSKAYRAEREVTTRVDKTRRNGQTSCLYNSKDLSIDVNGEERKERSGEGVKFS